MTAFEAMRVRRATMELDALLCEQIATGLEKMDAGLTAWEALRCLAQQMRDSSAEMAKELQ